MINNLLNCKMDLLEKYGYQPDLEKVSKTIEAISTNMSLFQNAEVYRTCFSVMDITSLNMNDTLRTIAGFVEKVNALRSAFPAYPLPASICVYPDMIPVVVEKRLNPELHATAVGACFPASHTFLEVKLLECRMAVESGADEIDVVIPHSLLRDGRYEAVEDELRRIRSTVDNAAPGRSITLKVILETGTIVEAETIARASFIAMESGADFIKTSTGKNGVGATPSAVFVMCECIKRFYEVTGRKVGIKPAGGMSTVSDALSYYSIIHTLLGKDWLDKSLFRLGVSRMANSLLSALEEKNVVFF